MKEELKPYYIQIHNLLGDYNNIVYFVDQSDKPIFESVLKAAFAKCIEFNYYILNKDRSGSYFLLSSLRSITEEIIALKFISTKFEGDVDILVSEYSNKNCFDLIKSQAQFFKEIESSQPIMNERLVPNTLSSASENLKNLWKNEGLKGDKDWPTTSHMATDSKLIKLYDYLYAATSSHVHFNPHSLMRMGWTDDMNANPQEHTFSTNNFDRYYEDFNIYYGSFLFLEMVISFKQKLELKSNFIQWIEKVELILKSVNRIPELVTFEEFNIKPGIWDRILGLEHKKSR